jgi:hypothetical protein
MSEADKAEKRYSPEQEAILKKTIVGLTENVVLRGEKGKATLTARIDTGATKSSIDLMIAAKLGLGPVVDSKLIKSAYGVKLRPVVRADVEICGRVIQAKFTLADRNHMKYLMLIGQNILRKDFLVDPCRNNKVDDREKS